MTFGNKHIQDTLYNYENSLERLRLLLVYEAANRLVLVAEKFTEETDFTAAIHSEGPDNANAYVAVQNEVAEFFKREAGLAFIMNSSLLATTIPAPHAPSSMNPFAKF